MYRDVKLSILISFNKDIILQIKITIIIRRPSLGPSDKHKYRIQIQIRPTATELASPTPVDR